MKDWKLSILKKDVSIKEGIKFLEKNKTGIILFVNSKNKLLGTLTDGDFRRALLKTNDLDIKISSIMSKKYKYLNENFSNKTAIKKMKKFNIEHLPVIKKNKQIINLIKINDIYENIKNTNFIIFAGGKGKRVRPLSDKTPKPMLKVKGRPMLEKLVLKAKKEGFKNFFFITNYLSKVIENYFKDGKKFGVNIQYVKEKKPLGTCGGLRLIKELSRGPIIVSNGDVLSNFSYKKILEHHVKYKNDFTLTVKKITVQNPFGVVKIQDSEVLNIVEKPIQFSNISAGVNVVDTNLIKYIKKNSFLDMNGFIKLLLKKNCKIGAYGVYEDWTDFGTFEQLERYN